MHSFSGIIIKIGINPCLDVPEKIIGKLLSESGKTKGPIPVAGTLNGKPFRQTIVKYKGEWRLYLNGAMRKDAGIDVGDKGNVKVSYDPETRIVPMHPGLRIALEKNKKAKQVFEKLSPSHKNEISKYLGFSKTKDTEDRNIKKVILQLTGKETEDLNFLIKNRKGKRSTSEE